MEEIFKISTRLSVLRDGSYCGTLITKETDENEVTRLMIGRQLVYSRNTKIAKSDEVVLEVKGLNCGKIFKNISFKLYAGEVLGFYGLVGAGRTEIMEALFGLRTVDDGDIIVNGVKVNIVNPEVAVSKGIALAPENRKEQGLVLGMNCKDNITLPQISALASGPFTNQQREVGIYETYHKSLDIRSPSWRQTVGNLSGGNQQKIVIGKWLAMNLKILIVDEPTKGIDVGSKAEIHNLLRKLASEGYGVIIISSEMPEILHVSDRIFAMYQGTISQEFTADEVTEDSLMRAISNLEPA